MIAEHNEKKYSKSGFNISLYKKAKKTLVFMDGIAIPLVCTFIYTGLNFNKWLCFYTILKFSIIYNSLIFVALSIADMEMRANFVGNIKIQRNILVRRSIFVLINNGIMIGIQIIIYLLMRYTNSRMFELIPRDDTISKSLIFTGTFLLGHILVLSILFFEFFLLIRVFYLKKNALNKQGMYVVDVSKKKIYFFMIIFSLYFGLAFLMSTFYISTLNPIYIYIDTGIYALLNLIIWYFGFRYLKSNQFVIPEYDEKCSNIRINLNV